MTNRQVFRFFLAMTVIFTVLIFCGMGKLTNYVMNLYPPFPFFSFTAFLIGITATTVLMALTTITMLMLDLITQYRQSKKEEGIIDIEWEKYTRKEEDKFDFN